MDPDKNGPFLQPPTTFLPSVTTPSEAEVNKTRIAEEFYATYDVMTGVRIAITLGGFFALMVILVLYKSKSKTEKALEDPDFTAAAVAEVEEEERQIAAALEATAYQQLNPRKSRRSLDTSSMPPGWIKTTTRFSSVGGYSSLMNPPSRPHSRLPAFIDEDSTEEDQNIYDEICQNRLLEVPRRPSNITCSSSCSSYLERRDSSLIAGLPALPPLKTRTRRRQSSPLLEVYDCCYPIDIQVIQPTPGGSPFGSDRALHSAERPKPRLAPLASISSVNSSLGTELPSDPMPDVDCQSIFSDSVFNVSEEDTDKEVEEFSTDTDSDAKDAEACALKTSSSNFVSVISPTTVVCISPRSNSKSSLTVVENPTGLLGRQREISKGSMCDETATTSWAQETLF